MCNTPVEVQFITSAGCLNYRVTGAGLALTFKQRFLLNFKAYSDACHCGDVLLGKRALGL
jgi:hypothetical protein